MDAELIRYLNLSDTELTGTYLHVDRELDQFSHQFCHSTRHEESSVIGRGGGGGDRGWLARRGWCSSRLGGGGWRDIGANRIHHRATTNIIK